MIKNETINEEGTTTLEQTPEVTSKVIQSIIKLWLVKNSASIKEIEHDRKSYIAGEVREHSLVRSKFYTGQCIGFSSEIAWVSGLPHPTVFLFSDLKTTKGVQKMIDVLSKRGGFESMNVTTTRKRAEAEQKKFVAKEISRGMGTQTTTTVGTHVQ